MYNNSKCSKELITVLSIFGTRPEVIKFYPVLERFKQCDLIRSLVVSTSQHREMIDDLLELFSLDLDHDLNIIQKDQSLVDISIRALAGLDPLLAEYKPDLIMVQGDTTTAFIGALAAFYHRIPVSHLEAGLRSFDVSHPYPEEINRRLISMVSDLHFAPTENNAQNLLNEGIDPSKVYVTGNTVIDSLLLVASKNRGCLSQYLPSEVLDSERLLLVTAHRRENWGKPLEELCAALLEVAGLYPDVQIVYPVHLNPNVRKTVFSILAGSERIHLVDPLPYEPFVEAMNRSYLIITDSGGIQEEGPSLGKPILVFREVTERPEGLTTGGVRLVGTRREDVVRNTIELLEDQSAYIATSANHSPYGDGMAAHRVVQAILHRFNHAERPEDFSPDQNGKERMNSNAITQ